MDEKHQAKRVTATQATQSHQMAGGSLYVDLAGVELTGWKTSD